MAEPLLFPLGAMNGYGLYRWGSSVTGIGRHSKYSCAGGQMSKLLDKSRENKGGTLPDHILDRDLGNADKGQRATPYRGAPV